MRSNGMMSDVVSLPDPVSDESDVLQGAVDYDDEDVCSHSDMSLPNAFDDDDEWWSDTDMPDSLGPASISVPQPSEVACLRGKHDVAEFYSPPRVVGHAVSRGLTGCLSLDLQTHWDFNKTRDQDLSLELLDKLKIQYLMLSPPCTAFSVLQELWNFKKYTAEKVKAILDQGRHYLNHSMRCAMAQHRGGRIFVHEHPSHASSWKEASVKEVVSQPGVYTAVFDQCMFGLVTKVTRTPTRKRTKLLTNSLAIACRFNGVYCDKSHPHQVIQGDEGGVRRSVWAQQYPAPMVAALVEGIIAHNSQHPS